jgi:hypothetical protein
VGAGGQALDTLVRSLKPALDDFAQARHPHAESAPTLTQLMIFLFEAMADDEDRARLEPATDDLRSSPASRPAGSGSVQRGTGGRARR